MITALNITHAGRSQTYELELDEFVSDADVIRIAEEVSGLKAQTLANFMVDRLHGMGGEDVVYVRPKVPFGAAERDPDRGLLARMSANIMPGFLASPTLKKDISDEQLVEGCVAMARKILAWIDSGGD